MRGCSGQGYEELRVLWEEDTENGGSNTEVVGSEDIRQGRNEKVGRLKEIGGTPGSRKGVNGRSEL